MHVLISSSFALKLMKFGSTLIRGIFVGSGQDPKQHPSDSLESLDLALGG